MEISCRKTARRTIVTPSGFAAMELLVVVSVIALLSGVLLSLISQSRSKARSVQCLANLQNIYAGFTQYGMDNSFQYPAPLDAGRSWESMLQRYLQQPLVFGCPSDDEVFPSVGSSYDWRDTPNPLSSLAGRRWSAVTRNETILAFETLGGWHQKHRMNALRVNGSVEILSDDDCLQDLQLPVGTIAPGPTPALKAPI